MPVEMLRRILLAACLLVTTGCTTEAVLQQVPESQLGQAALSAFGDIRFSPGENGAANTGLEQKSIERIRQLHGDTLRNKPVDIAYLCVSGGGSNGAYGAGFLAGWTARGNRPDFDVVTGISTGSMIAPLAFLGPKYDTMLREAYTTIETQDVAETQVVSALFGRSSGLADNTGLKRLIARFLTQGMLDEIAVESRKGRSLLIGTTYLEAQRPVIWDIGAIAESGAPQALELVRDIILASASIPGAFAPVDIAVVANGKSYNEMHVDGGVTRQVFLYPPSYRPAVVDKAIGWKATRTVYIIRNNKISPEYSDVKPKLLNIVGKSLDTLIKADGVSDLFRIYAQAQRDRLKFNYTSIPESFTGKSKSAFDKAYMTALFEAGYAEAQHPDPWQHTPPGM